MKGVYAPSDDIVRMKARSSNRMTSEKCRRLIDSAEKMHGI